MEFVKTARGGEKLIYKGYSYTKKATKSNRLRWECSQRVAHSCKGAVTTSLQVNTIFSFCVNLLLVNNCNSVCIDLIIDFSHHNLEYIVATLIW